MAAVCAAHLVRASNGIEPFERFLASYRRHDAGLEHVLLFILKGFRDDASLAPYRERLVGLDAAEFLVPDRGFDIGPYFKTARAYDHQTFVFLNSYSVVLAAGWLEKLHAQLAKKGVGLVGATGSWASWRSIGEQRFAAERHVLRPLRRWLQPLVRLRGRLRYPGYPNPHMRTNAFMLRRETMLRLRSGMLVRKRGAYMFESGRRSLTRQVQGMGLRAILVGRDGRGYETEAWPESRTFWQSDQENLLIADNQTELYQKGSRATRAFLQRLAWAPHLAPFVPPFVDQAALDPDRAGRAP
jgi:hypothetical protein